MRKRRIIFNHTHSRTQGRNIHLSTHKTSPTIRPNLSRKHKPHPDMVTTSESNSASTSQSRLSALSATLPSNPTSSTSPLVASLPVSNVPPLYTTPPLLPNNSPPSRTTRDQAATVECVLPFITGTSDGVRPRFNDAGVPPLAKQMHVAFARDSMERLPAPYVGYDAARPWLVYWSVAALASLGCLEEQVPGMVESGLGLGEVRQLRDR